MPATPPPRSRLARRAAGFPPLAAAGAALLLAAARLQAGTVADLDRANGLPDAPIGAPFTAFQGMQQTEDTGRWTSYKRPADKLTYGGFELADITYNFFKGKLYSIHLEVEGKRSTKGILQLLERQFGTQHTLERHEVPNNDAKLEIREWSGAKIYLLYKNASNYAGGQLIFLDKPTWDQLQIPKQERAAQIRKLLDGSFTNGDL